MKKKGLILIWGVVFLFCENLYAEKWINVKSEFKSGSKKFIFGIFGALNNRGFSNELYKEYSKTIGVTLGCGLGIFELFSIDSIVSREWKGHKSFYFYLDGEYIVERNSYTFLYNSLVKKTKLLSLNQMFIVRSYIPIFKIF